MHSKGLKRHQPYPENTDSTIHEKYTNNTTSNNTTRRSKKLAPAAIKNCNAGSEAKDIAFLSIWNDVTGKQEVMNSAIRKELDVLRESSIDQFSKIVCAFKTVVDLIQAQHLQKYIYYPVWNYDFVQFAKKINWFCENYNPNTIINKLAKKEQAHTVKSRLSLQTSTLQPEAGVKAMVDKEVAKKGRKTVADILRKKRVQ